MKLTFLLCISFMAMAEDTPELELNGRSEVTGQSRTFISADGSEERETPIRNYGDWDPKTKSCIVHLGTSMATYFSAPSRSACYQDSTQYESVRTSTKRELELAKSQVESLESELGHLWEAVGRALKLNGCRGDESFTVRKGEEQYGAQFYCVQGRWEQVVMATSGCVLLESDAKRLKDGDKEIAEWWGKCR